MANSTGVSSGTNSSRGLPASSRILRRYSVSNWYVIFTISSSGAQPGAGQPQVHVVERRLAQRHRANEAVRFAKRPNGGVAGAVSKRDCQGRADLERAVDRHAAVA